MLTNYKYFVRETIIEEINNKENFQTNVVSIGIKNRVDGTVAPSPLTNFLIKNYEVHRGKLNTIKAPAYVITRFLNYINERIEQKDPDFITLREAGLKGLELQHASSFLSYQTLIKNNKLNTFEHYANYLNDFYVFLNLEGITRNYTFQETIITTQYGTKRKKFVSFDEAPSPPIKPNKILQRQTYKKLKDFGENRLVMVIEFIEITKALYPEIALGIFFMFYGGLRRGEVVNLTKDSFDYKKNSHCIIKIRNRTKILFSHIKDNSKNQPKKERDQLILLTPLLDELLETHLKYFSKHPTALFTNQNGTPLTGKSFEGRFKKIRKKFEEELSQKIERRNDYELIKGVIWSSHIGRGVFTNFLLSIGMPLTEVSIARGDESGESLMAYIEELNAQAALIKGSEVIAQRYKEYKNCISKKNLDSEEISQASLKGVATIEPQYITTFKKLYTTIK
ncbi:tyrosine-type recombinase/integrase [Bacillus sp. 1A]|uniref:tyrosine-type recombinase/integrase n=1 Tax=Bacillus sp. 1A TaxID=3461399 RepID=UPI004044DD0E